MEKAILLMALELVLGVLMIRSELRDPDRLVHCHGIYIYLYHLGTALCFLLDHKVYNNESCKNLNKQSCFFCLLFVFI